MTKCKHWTNTDAIACDECEAETRAIEDAAEEIVYRYANGTPDTNEIAAIIRNVLDLIESNAQG